MLNEKFNMQTDIFDVLSFLIYSQILNPGSKQSAYLSKYQFFENYTFSEDQMYTALNHIGESYETIKDYIYRTTNEAYEVNTSITYYDGTNFYFEIDREDDFRKKGPSKESRKCPLVSIGLLLDSNMFPIELKIYPGNESEKPHFGDVINEMKEKRKIQGRTIYVADKGLNCGNNIFKALLNGDGYIYSQTIKNSDEMRKKYIENDIGFEPIFNEYGEVEFYVKGFKHSAEITYEHKGEMHKKTLEQLQVVTWSRKYAEKTKYERDKLIAKAKSIIKNPSAYNKEKIGNAASYLKQVTYDAKGNIVENKSSLIINTEKIEEEARLDGYYMIVTSETDMKPIDVVNTYRFLPGIEDTFRVAKHFLKLRPIFLQRETRIKAHVLVCYLSLLILRILEKKVLEDKFSQQAIIEAIRTFQCAMIKPNTYFFFTYNEIANVLAKKSYHNAKLEIQTLSAIKNLFKDY
jgi:transposase